MASNIKRTKKQRPFEVTTWVATPEDPVLFSAEQEAALKEQDMWDKWLYSMGGCFVCGDDVSMLILCADCMHDYPTTKKLCNRHEWSQLKCNACCEKSPSQQ
jgi:hypothetical protein